MNPFQGLKHLYARSRRLPVRIRIAIVSAALTAVILIGFAAVVGRLVTDRLHSDFENELRGNAATLANSIEFNSAGQPDNSVLEQVALANDAEIRLVLADGQTIRSTSSTARFPTPDPSGVVSSGPLQVATAQIFTNTAIGAVPILLQYARPESAVDATVGRLWLFLAAGVAVGTLLAGIAGMAVANRAMRPISALTAAASEIATTRDTSRRIPEPESDDEVAELARTLDQMVRELDAARSETEGAMKRQREFVADASHELRTPLTSILANLELLEQSLAADPEEDDEAAAVASALRSSKRMNRLVGDLLLLARADAGRVGRRVDCDLAMVASEALEEVSPVADGHDFVAELDNAAPVTGNPDELHRMVLNLLENAIRHTPEGTTVSVELSERDGKALLTVADDGPGLPAGMESQVFDRFVRGEGPADRSSRNGTGTGLGLSIVRAVAVAHGGSVTAGSAEAGGARFEIRLPLASRSSEAPEKV
ncbi:MAG: HAMP domain-containing sensor histidine kinase [Solirubrobacterales bacterium]